MLEKEVRICNGSLLLIHSVGEKLQQFVGEKPYTNVDVLVLANNRLKTEKHRVIESLRLKKIINITKP